jgi:hypothetical protein
MAVHHHTLLSVQLPAMPRVAFWAYVVKGKLDTPSPYTGALISDTLFSMS